MSSPSKPATEEVAIPEQRVTAYLQARPDFFTRHPELLGTLTIPHQSGGAVSLIEHQVTVLRSQLDAERTRLNLLIQRARDYELLSSRLHGLVLTLIAANDRAGLERELTDAMTRELGAEAVCLKLFPVEPDVRALDPQVNAFLAFLAEDRVVCGPVVSEQTRGLFGKAADGIASAALIPIQAPGTSGVVAIGSRDPGRFGADMGTDFLERLGEVVSARLTALARA